MALPNIFATQPTGNVPAAFLDQNFAALGAIDCVPGTVAGIDALVYTPAANAPSITSYVQLQGFSFRAVASNTSGVTFRVGVLAVLNVYKPSTGGPVALVAGDIQNNGYYQLYYDVNLNGGLGGFHIYGTVVAAGGSSGATPPVRQTVMSGPVLSTGLPNFGGATGATTVTQTGTIVVTAAQGFNSSGSVDRVGQITNAAWTGLSTNGTMYLWLDIAINGTCTTGSTTLAPIYQLGGVPSTTNNQFTFNTAEMMGYIGNGGAAPAGFRVFVGQVTVAGGVVTQIDWYVLNGKFAAPFTATLPNAASATTFKHLLGTTEIYSVPYIEIRCTTADNGYAVGDRLTNVSMNYNIGVFPVNLNITGAINGQFATTALGWYQTPKTGGNAVALTVGSWSYRPVVTRGW